MTYYRHAEDHSSTEVVHDRCFTIHHDDEFERVEFVPIDEQPRFPLTCRTIVTQFPYGEEFRVHAQQINGWCWAPLYGSPLPCLDCKEPVT